MDIPKFKNVKQYLITSITFQNTWHSKESDINYGPDIPSYYQGKFSAFQNMAQMIWTISYDGSYESYDMLIEYGPYYMVECKTLKVTVTGDEIEVVAKRLE